MDLPIRMPNPSPTLDKNLAAMGPGILSSIGVGVWRTAPEAFPDSNTTLDTFQSAIKSLESRHSLESLENGLFRKDPFSQEWPRQTKPKKGQFMNFSQGHSGTKVQCESGLFSQGKTPEFTKIGEIHELFVLALFLVWFAGATPDFPNDPFFRTRPCILGAFVRAATLQKCGSGIFSPFFFCQRCREIWCEFW